MLVELRMEQGVDDLVEIIVPADVFLKEFIRSVSQVMQMIVDLPENEVIELDQDRIAELKDQKEELSAMLDAFDHLVGKFEPQ